MIPDGDDEDEGSGTGGPVIDPKFAAPANETLGQKQRRLTRMIAALIEYAYSQGFELTFGDAYRDPRLHGSVGEKKGYGHPLSAHKQRLAVDFNLFLDGKFCDGSQDHEQLGRYWESIGGSWGGRFGDGNHYSLEHKGVR